MKPIFNLRILIEALRYSLSGLWDGVRSHRPVQQEVLVFFVLGGLSWVCGLSPLKVFILLGSWSGVVVAELVNIAIETICDLVHPDRHPLVKRAKDAGSAAVFVVIVLNVVLWSGLWGGWFYGL